MLSGFAAVWACAALWVIAVSADAAWQAGGASPVVLAAACGSPACTAELLAEGAAAGPLAEPSVRFEERDGGWHLDVSLGTESLAFRWDVPAGTTFAVRCGAGPCRFAFTARPAGEPAAGAPAGPTSVVWRVVAVFFIVPAAVVGFGALGLAATEAAALTRRLAGGTL